eukprot:UN21424
MKFMRNIRHEYQDCSVYIELLQYLDRQIDKKGVDKQPENKRKRLSLEERNLSVYIDLLTRLIT